MGIYLRILTKSKLDNRPDIKAKNKFERKIINSGMLNFLDSIAYAPE